MSWTMTSSGSRWRMTSKLPVVIGALVASAVLGACADFERGARPPVVPDVVPSDLGAADIDAAVDAAPDAVFDSVAELPPDVAAGEYSFATDIHGVLLDRCGECHTTGAPRAFFLTTAPATDYPVVLKLVKVATPASSKLLVKGTAEDQHGGGGVLAAGTDDYEAILGWIAEGALP